DMKLKKVKIGELLLSKNLITEAQLKVALSEQARTGKKLGETLIDLNYITEYDLLNAVSEQLGVEMVSISDYELTPDLKKLIPEQIARKYKVIPLKYSENLITLATNDPMNIDAMDELSRMTRKNILPVLLTTDDLFYGLEKIYGTEDRLFKIATDVEKKIIGNLSDDEFLESLSQDAPIVNLVDGILAKGINEGASDIHIEPDEDKLRVRYRIDGILHEVLAVNKSLHSPITSRIKILANMDIAEKRAPQDGRFKIRVNFKDIDFRASTLPTYYGEKVVLRILDRSNVVLDLKSIGMSSQNLEIYESIISKPYGIILITGPTGSGKTTTLYATLSKLNSVEKNIVTVEDPIEYNFKLINQVQVDESANVTFASALRSILRQDPDIIMVGEIRDKETAEISIQASLTGHLVLSTIHTNDAVSAVVRLMDMGIEPFLVGSSLIGIVGQRLVRKVCMNCAVEYTPPQEFLDRIGEIEENVRFVKGEGCPECHYTGYQGRIGIYEVLKINSVLREMVVRGANSEELRKAAIQGGFSTMFDSGLKLAKMGITTIEEILRVTVIKDE
ncbi:GspE/PulE family protein, partial [Deferribacterales bacterium Es71-Z0220]|uniref:GspE/PulE family protein n=1 Tax=Deferrivibrio essentukiensis TaxID=2880922 RepID=UPI001F601165